VTVIRPNGSADTSATFDGLPNGFALVGTDGTFAQSTTPGDQFTDETTLIRRISQGKQMNSEMERRWPDAVFWKRRGGDVT
jgi:hypothetical protein